MVRRWRSWFLEGRQNVHDDERSGSPVTATDNAAVAAVRNVVEADRRVTIDEIMIRLPPGIEIRRSSIGTIMSDVLNFLKVCTRWVQRMEAARAFLEMHQRDGDQLFSSIVTGDESWVHHSTPETKRQSMVWKKPEESAPKKAKVTISAGKVMAMENFKWKIFTHPPYSPELAPSDFHLYPALKWHLGGKHFANDDEVQAEANHWLRRQDTAWYNSAGPVQLVAEVPDLKVWIPWQRAFLLHLGEVGSVPEAGGDGETPVDGRQRGGRGVAVARTFQGPEVRVALRPTVVASEERRTVFTRIVAARSSSESNRRPGLREDTG
ncbi:hypothetical protein LAZ67_2005535 [Cordylochernes scorpioides]|uniref:Transposase n=1 Tax=Cordylochernes scorpioides TaxID=51811 RepID=A0ABY6K593_9ARAC|nr:hypothetical protein LAZ67_2005535 [Cordylochernes scorpioides]